VLVTGAIDGKIRFYGTDCETLRRTELNFLFEIDIKGIIVGMALSNDYKRLAVVISPENKLGRWICIKGVKSHVKIFTLFE